MKITAVICNIVLFGFTCLVLLVDGPPTDISYIVFTLWLLLTLILNSAVIFFGGAGSRLRNKEEGLEQGEKAGNLSSAGTVMSVVAIICNAVLLGFICWAFVDQYPHPEEEGFLAYAVLIALTPILSLVALFRRGTGEGWLNLRPRKNA